MSELSDKISSLESAKKVISAAAGELEDKKQKTFHIGAVKYPARQNLRSCSDEGLGELEKSLNTALKVLKPEERREFDGKAGTSQTEKELSGEIQSLIKGHLGSKFDNLGKAERNRLQDKLLGKDSLKMFSELIDAKIQHLRTELASTNQISEGKNVDGFDANDEKIKELAKGKPIAIESSALSIVGNTAIIATDKPVPGQGAIFTGTELAGESPKLTPRINAGLLNTASKLEASTVAQFGDHSVLLHSTGFDRIKPDKEGKVDSSFDTYNMVIATPLEKDLPQQILGETARPGEKGEVKSSLKIREGLEKAIGSPYFKIEGLASVPTGKSDEVQLVFGVRETGPSYKDPTPCFKMVGVTLKREPNGNLIVQDDYKVIYDFKVNGDKNDETNPSGLNQKVGISSLEFDKQNDRFVIATTYEKAKNPDDPQYGEFGTYFWTLSKADMGERKPPTLLKGEDKKPLHTFHKVEGMDFKPGTNNTELILVADDDRALKDDGNVLKSIRSGLNQTWFGELRIGK